MAGGWPFDHVLIILYGYTAFNRQIRYMSFKINDLGRK